MTLRTPYALTIAASNDSGRAHRMEEVRLHAAEVVGLALAGGYGVSRRCFRNRSGLGVSGTPSKCRPSLGDFGGLGDSGGRWTARLRSTRPEGSLEVAHCPESFLSFVEDGIPRKGGARREDSSRL